MVVHGAEMRTSHLTGHIGAGAWRMQVLTAKDHPAIANPTHGRYGDILGLGTPVQVSGLFSRPEP